MYVWSDEWKKLKPPDDVLRKCHQVLLTDVDAGGMGEAFWKIKKWCKEYCKSFVWMDVTDVSDASYQWDEIATFYFYDSRDAVMFTIKYKSGK